MELLIIIFLLSIFIFVSILRRIAPASTAEKPRRTVSKSKQAEARVNEALCGLDMKSYVLFENVILPSNGNTAHTEIDHIVVSPYGIFCIETKSHSGAIYAYEKNKDWVQYIGKRKFTFNSPQRQNYKHVSAIEALLAGTLRAPVHSYVIFPNAYKVVTDSKYVYKDIDALVRRISMHKQPLYNIDECTHILRTLAYESSKKDLLYTTHVKEVRSYLAAKAS